MKEENNMNLKKEFTSYYNKPLDKEVFSEIMGHVQSYLSKDTCPIVEQVFNDGLGTIGVTREYLSRGNQPILLRFTNELVTEEYVTTQFKGRKPITFVFYIFNYYNAEHLLQALQSLIELEIIQGGYSKKGYFDVYYNRNEFIHYESNYVYNKCEKEKYKVFDTGLADRNSTSTVKQTLYNLKHRINKLPYLRVMQVIQSTESEAGYIAIQHMAVPITKLKISIRNHPINTQSQLVCYIKNFESMIALENRLVSVLETYDWDNHRTRAYKYYDVTPTSLVFKTVGDDLENYTDVQRAYVERIRRYNAKRKGVPLIMHPSDRNGDSGMSTVALPRKKNRRKY